MQITNDSSTASLCWTDLVSIGRVAKAQGRYGEVAIQPFTDVPARFEALERVFIEVPSGSPSLYAVEGVRLHKGRPILKLLGVSDIGGAEALAGREIRVPESDLEPLPEDSLYHFQILGMTVLDRDRSVIGTVEDVLSTGGTDVLVVRGAAGEEALVPLCREICPVIDPEAGCIELDAPEGLLGLNAD
jgi:16S rRNA processing protein RimM